MVDVASGGRTFLITGGSGSGKSALAQRLAARLGDPVMYLATGQASSPEMTSRIRKHQASRPRHWPTVEAPRNLAAALAAAPEAPVVLLDDLASLAHTCLPPVSEADGQLQAPEVAEQTARETLEGEVDAVLDLCARQRRALVMVTSEVGAGVLPPSPLERLFKDVLGRLNARLAQRVERTLLVVAGLAVDLTVLNQTILHDLGLEDTATAGAGAMDRRRTPPSDRFSPGT
jgi:adenosylcobinamide kinase/adenosylcobinamide-phosphate guanylyltransferase